jgi:hypothetical protein
MPVQYILNFPIAELLLQFLLSGQKSPKILSCLMKLLSMHVEARMYLYTALAVNPLAFDDVSCNHIASSFTPITSS